MLVGFVVIQSFLDGANFAHRVITSLCLFALVLSGIRSMSASRWRPAAALTLGVIALVASMLREITARGPLVDVAYVCYLLTFVLLVSALRESVFSTGPANYDRIIGAISIYLALTIAWAFAYALLEIHWPGSFTLDETNPEGISPNLISEMFYFSTTTLTTLGYGDIVPVSQPARTLAVMEAMTGQVYIAVVIAYLVGQNISERVRAASEVAIDEPASQDQPDA